MTDPLVHAALARFAALPVEDVDPGVVSAWLPGVAAPTLHQLRVLPRFSARLAQLLARDHGLPPCPADAFALPVVALALLDREELHAAAVQVAALRHGNAIRRLLRRQDQADLDDAVGEAATGFARTHADPATPDMTPGAGGPQTPAGLARAILAAVPACLGTWLDALPDGVRARAALKLGAAAGSALDGPDGAAVLLAWSRAAPALAHAERLA